MFKLEISTSGAAFRNPFSGEEDEVMEAAEIRSLLAKVSYELEHGRSFGVIIDANGNKVGSWSR